MLSESLRAVISQTLLKTKDGNGRVAAHEIMIGTPAIRNLIRENKVAQMYSAIQTGQNFGMQTLDQNLLELVRRNVVSRGRGAHGPPTRMPSRPDPAVDKPTQGGTMERDQAMKFMHDLLRLMAQKKGSTCSSPPAFRRHQDRRQDHAGRIRIR